MSTADAIGGPSPRDARPRARRGPPGPGDPGSQPPTGPVTGPPDGAPSGSGRDPFVPRAMGGRGRALALAVVAHLLLILGLAFGVAWHDETPTTVAAELWSATPQAAAPRAVEPTPTLPPPLPPPVVPRAAARPPEPTPEPRAAAPVLPDPQIAIEKARREQARRDEAAAEQVRSQRQRAEREAQAAQRRDDDLAAQQRERRTRAAADAEQRKTAERRQAEQTQADQARLRQEKADKAARAAEAQAAAAAERVEATRAAALREAQLKRILGQAGATGAPTDTGAAQRSSGPSASYAGRVAARVKPNIVFTDAVDGNPGAVVQVRLGADGTITLRRLIQSSGVKAWDDAVLRAIDRTEVLPLDNGRAPPQFEIGFRPKD